LAVGPGWISWSPCAPMAKLTFLLSKESGPAWHEGDRAARHHVLLLMCLALCRPLSPVGLGDVTPTINTLPTFRVPCDCRQELQCLNTKPTNVFMVQETETAQTHLNFWPYVFKDSSPLSLVWLGAKTLKQEFCLRCSEFGVLFAALIL